MTTAALHLGEIAAFWRSARRLYTIYSALDRTFEIGSSACPDLEYPVDRSEPEVIVRVRQWFDHMDGLVQVWQLRQLLQSTNLQTGENLGDLVIRHLNKRQKTEIDRDKIDFLLVQYFAHCAPQGLYERPITLEEVGNILQPVLGAVPGHFPDWVTGLDAKLEKLNQCNSLEELQNSGALVEVRELKLGSGDEYFELPCLIAFTKFNFLARRAFFRAMHLDLHSIRNSVNELQQRGFTAVDCSEAGLSDRESLEHIRHLVHQWKTPFRAPYSGGNSFLQLVQLRQALQQALDGVKKEAGARKEAASPPASKAFAEILPGYTDLAPEKLASDRSNVEDIPDGNAISSVPASTGDAASPPSVEAAPESPITMVLPMEEFVVEAAPVLAEEEAPALPGAAIRLEEPGPKKTVPMEAVSLPEAARPGTAAPGPPPAAKPALAAPIAPREIQEPMPPPAQERPAPAASVSAAPPVPAPMAPIVSAAPAGSRASVVAPGAGELEDKAPAAEDDYLEQCVADIRRQLLNMPPKGGPGVTPIVLAGCKLLIATWEAEAFAKGAASELSNVLQRAVAARTILHVSLERTRKQEPTDLPAAMQIGKLVVEEMKRQVAKAKEAKNIDAAVNLAATTKRLLGLLEEGKKLGG